MRPAAVSIAVLLAIVGGLAAYVYTAPPLPFALIPEESADGTLTVAVESVTPFGVGDAVVVDAGDASTSATIAAIDADRNALTLDTPLRGTAPSGSRVALADVATLVAVFDERVGLRRFPRVDSRTYAHAPAGMSREVMLFVDGWAKVEIATPIEGWAMAISSRVVHAGLVDELAFSTRAAVRRFPYRDEALVRWEGRVVKKTSEPEDDGTPAYRLQAASIDGEHRVFHLSPAAWATFSETDYIVDREGEGLAHADIPIGFTELGPPYELLERDGERVRIQWQDQGWVPDDSCRFEVRYNYSTTRRQDVSLRLRASLTRLSRLGRR